MTSVAVLIPVLGRESRVQPLVDEVLASDPRAYPMFLCSPGDDEEIAAVIAAGLAPRVVDWSPGPGDYARKINYGFLLATSIKGTEWAFLGADDLRFYPGWFDACLATHDATGCCVIGTNDLGNAKVVRGAHSTHSLVHRDYLECGTADEAEKILHEGYDHQWVDNEFVETAQARDTFASANAAHVEHLHPFWRKGIMDATYEKALGGAQADQLLYQSRRHLWAP